jgi:exodeoxyribonuclease VII small subunit
MTKQKTESKATGTAPGFEKSLADLEKIVSDMESGKLGLEEMIDRFEKGQALIEFCTKKLNEVERRIEILVKKGDQVVAEPFEPESDEDAAPEAGAEEETEEKDSLF